MENDIIKDHVDDAISVGKAHAMADKAAQDYIHGSKPQTADGLRKAIGDALTTYNPLMPVDIRGTVIEETMKGYASKFNQSSKQV